ncbi:MAG: ABC transporter permease [Myxococcales bacterium]
MWFRLRALMIKELLAVWRDPRSRAVLLGPPIIQLLVFGYAATFDLQDIPVAFYNEDQGADGRALIARFSGSTVFHPVAELAREADIARVILDREATAVVHLGESFSRDLRLGAPAPVQLIVDGRNSNTALITVGYANAIVRDFNIDWLRHAGKALPPANLVIRSWFNPNLHSRWFIVPGIVALLTLVVTLVVTALSVARERELGTFDQLLVTPLRPVHILMGKALAPLFIGIVEGTGIVLVAVAWFRVPFLGSVTLLYVGMILYLLAVIGVGLMISSLVRTQQQAILGAFLFLVPSVLLSGFATPIANMSEAIKPLTYLNPMRYFLIIVRGLFLEGMSADLVAQQLWPLALIAVVTLASAHWLFRHRLS